MKRQIKKAVPADAQKLTELAFRSKSYWEYSHEFMEAFRHELVIKENYIDKNHVYIITANNQEYAGFYGLTDKGAKEGELDFLFISPEYIRQGYGDMLWNHMLQQAKRLGIANMLIQSDPNAMNFYIDRGAVFFKNIPSESITGRTFPLLKYYLDK